MEPWWNNTGVFLGNDKQNFPESPRALGNSGKKSMGLLRDFKKKMQQTELHSRHLIQVEVPVNSLLPKHHRYNNCRYESAPTRSKRGRLYHKTIAIILASRFLQIGDDQWPHTDDVGYNIHKMRHIQVIGQDGLFQSGARGHPTACLSTFLPIDDEIGHGKPVQTTEHTGSCPL